MWRCGYSCWMNGPFFLHGWLWALIFLALAGGGIYLLVRLVTSRRRASSRYVQDRFDSIAILKERLAKGEISREEYARMKELLECP